MNTVNSLAIPEIVKLLPIDWQAIAAIATFLTAFIAISIAIYGHRKDQERERKSHEKEAIEKLLTPIRKELQYFSMSKWDNWHLNRWHQLEDLRLDFPLQYYWLNPKIRQSLEKFDQEFNRFNNLSGQLKIILTKIISNKFREFLIEYKIENGDNFDSENIVNAHWSCVVGGKFGPSVTLYSLVMWDKNLVGYIKERQQDREIPNTKIDTISFSIHSTSSNKKINFTEQQSNELLYSIKKEIEKHPKIEEYRKKWQELFNDGLRLIKEIDLWLSIQ